MLYQSCKDDILELTSDWFAAGCTALGEQLSKAVGTVRLVIPGTSDQLKDEELPTTFHPLNNCSTER